MADDGRVRVRCPQCTKVNAIPSDLISSMIAEGTYNCANCGTPLGPPPQNMSTTPELPGHRIVRTLGVVSVLTAAAGFTAGMKGNDALAQGKRELYDQAHALGANAVVGLAGSPFGAAGGITKVFGGDAVGVLIMGTAVVVEPLEPE